MSNYNEKFLNWRDNVDNGSMMLRDIIDLETTYARLNGGANEPETNKIGEIALNADVVRVKSDQVELSVKDKEKDIKKDDVTDQETEDFDNDDDEERRRGKFIIGSNGSRN